MRHFYSRYPRGGTAAGVCNLALLVILWSLSAQPAQAAEDLPGSSDPLGVPRVPHSWIVLYQHDEQILNRTLAIGRVDKTRREVRLKDEIDIQASLESATYQMPRGVRSEAVIEHYTALLGDGELFSCQGRACGRSNDWANYIFNEAMLYGLDTRQYYFAGEYQGRLVAVYVIERGNRRVYAHLRVLTPTSPFLAPDRSLAADLGSDGYVVLEGVMPAPDGSIAAAAAGVLEALRPEVAALSDSSLFVVCHLSGNSALESLLTRSGRCAESAAELLRSEGGPDLRAQGVGPLAPRAGEPASRIELVAADRSETN